MLLPEEGFKPISQATLFAWLGGYTLFLLYAAANTSGFLFIDNANLMIHEAGHLWFSWAGHYTHILGGTLGELIVPAACFFLFMYRGETQAVAFCSFWFFENFLYIASYMGDARAATQPLVGGDESDWALLFEHWKVLHLDTTIAAWTRGIGWLGMIATMGWLAWMYFQNPATDDLQTGD
jgi:hypothetical protein